tara:strand:+ start:115 stop:354 length:240 start_codon:yes stop_codon:yes gene_type:complete
MKGQMRIHYDEEGDYLTIFVGESRSNYGEDITDYITIFRDTETDEVIGIGILNFKDQTKNLKQIKIDLPSEISSFAKSD